MKLVKNSEVIRLIVIELLIILNVFAYCLYGCPFNMFVVGFVSTAFFSQLFNILIKRDKEVGEMNDNTHT